eukprot:1160473-Pelagomonas_calceolata.AAC.6
MVKRSLCSGDLSVVSSGENRPHQVCVQEQDATDTGHSLDKLTPSWMLGWTCWLRNTPCSTSGDVYSRVLLTQGVTLTDLPCGGCWGGPAGCGTQLAALQVGHTGVCH